ncbi:MAG: helix-turn-helix domain-containing protein [Candidatus Krumholzibacteriales bacterium]
MKNEKGREDKKKTAGSLTSEKTVGELLSEARNKDGRTRAEISAVTKIPESSLKYLETDNFDMLPAPVYVMGFLRSYAAELGMDVDYILSKYQVHSGHNHRTRGDHWEEKEIEEEQEIDYGSIARKLIGPAAALAVIVALAVILLNREEDADVKPPSAIPQAEEFVDKETRERLNGSEKPGIAPPDNGGSGSQDSETAFPEPDREERAGPMELKLTANPSDSTWFDIITISSENNGPDTTFHDFILLPGREKLLKAQNAFVLRTIGNAGGFTAEFNGRKLPTFGEKHEIVRGVYLGRDSTSIKTE